MRGKWAEVTITLNYHPDGHGSCLRIRCEEDLDREERIGLFELIREVAERQHERLLSGPITPTTGEAGR